MSKFKKGSELDKQIYKEGEPTWGCKYGVLDVEEFKEWLEEVELEMIKKYKRASVPIMKIIKEKAGRGLTWNLLKIY